MLANGELRKPKDEEEIHGGEQRKQSKAMEKLGNHSSAPEEPPIPISAQFSAAAIHETAAKLKLLAAGSDTTPVTPSAATVPLADHPDMNELSLTPAAGGNQAPKAVRYRECMKNHAANIGGSSLDGCGEFMPGGEDGSVDGLRCAACGCHRNFHRREVEGETLCECQRSKLEKKRALMATPGSGMMGDENGLAGSMSTGGLKKRFRTKFSGEQKERMLELADKLGWKIQKQDEVEVQQFCSEVGVKRHVLKVWMHNNKHTFGSAKKPS